MADVVLNVNSKHLIKRLKRFLSWYYDKKIMIRADEIPKRLKHLFTSILIDSHQINYLIFMTPSMVNYSTYQKLTSNTYLFKNDKDKKTADVTPRYVKSNTPKVISWAA